LSSAPELLSSCESVPDTFFLDSEDSLLSGVKVPDDNYLLLGVFNSLFLAELSRRSLIFLTSSDVSFLARDFCGDCYFLLKAELDLESYSVAVVDFF